MMMKQLIFILATATSIVSIAHEAMPKEKLQGVADTSMRWESMTTPGIQAQIQESSRSKEEGRLIVRYRITAKGVSRNQVFTMIQWPISAAQPEAVFGGITFDTKGLAVCDGTEGHCGDPATPNDPIDFTFMPAKGEIYRIALISDDKKIKIAVSVVPDPLVGTSGPCSVEAVRFTPRFESVVIRGRGFQPSEKVRWNSASADEKILNDVFANVNGEFTSVVIPAVKGKSGGDFKLKIEAKGCSPEIGFHWGR
jgi:hypothetical protein